VTFSSTTFQDFVFSLLNSSSMAQHIWLSRRFKWN